ncbi:hypothetical protein NGM99_17110 [Mesorhizobium sp. RP14(2022)]|uniref:Uncharacterized protein n=1 Tax=Mesorhizobium liriopis TaxID=2953882 RepID=A0ABT1C9K3_9HYPH|nr:hypothetical protein [Mesorhizobium liriopis]MCO6051506.1 hypothetical protein [Mesorhizobium liriopis]
MSKTFDPMLASLAEVKEQIEKLERCIAIYHEGEEDTGAGAYDYHRTLYWRAMGIGRVIGFMQKLLQAQEVAARQVFRAQMIARGKAGHPLTSSPVKEE